MALQSCTVTTLILHSQFLTALAMNHLVCICLGASIIDTPRLREAVESSNMLAAPTTFPVEIFFLAYRAE